MREAFSAVVPAWDQQQFTGVVLPVTDPRAGVLLLDASDEHTVPSIPSLFAELALYFQAAQLVTLQVELPAESALTQRIGGLVGGVSLLRSLGAARVVILSATSDRSDSRSGGLGAVAKEVAAALSGEVLPVALADQQERRLPEVVRIVRRLTATFREVADATLGMITLLVQPLATGAAQQTAPAVASMSGYRPSRAVRAVRPACSTCPIYSICPATRPIALPGSPSALIFPLPVSLPFPVPIAQPLTTIPEAAVRAEADTASCARTGLLSQLYSWPMALVHALGTETTRSFSTTSAPSTRTPAAPAPTPGPEPGQPHARVGAHVPPGRRDTTSHGRQVRQSSSRERVVLPISLPELERRRFAPSLARLAKSDISMEHALVLLARCNAPKQHVMERAEIATVSIGAQRGRS